ncbi:MAG: penicillin-binding protein [Desulfovibrionales bacterium]|nr:penicillin-binding protein [Desulfovibrionales bacterium]
MSRRLAAWGARLLLALGGAAVLGAAVFLVLDALYPLDRAALHPEPATLVTDRRGEWLRVFVPADGQLRLQTPLQDVSPLLVRGLIASEDRWFGLHPGVNPVAVLRAAVSNLRAGRVVSGASTIPMQLARLADPKPRTLWSKLREAFRAVQMTVGMRREEILERYVNLLPFGGNLVGAAAASWAWFGKEPKELSWAETALLIVIPRAPNAYDPLRHPEAAKRARDRLLREFADLGLLIRKEAALAETRPLPLQRRPFPFAAPHAARMALEELGPAPRIRTSLDAEMQRAVRALVKRRAPGLRALGVGNAACVVADLKTRRILALAGSVDYLEDGYAGRMNLALARRSPGSTLKPFLYGLALDKGLIVPDSYVLDTPTDFSGYVPVNYDQTYHGRVTVREALARSLNVPAVRLLARVGLDDFHDLLARGGLTLAAPEHYGLPLALGACQASLVELTGLYAALGDGGAYRPLRLDPAPSSGEEPSGVRLLSPEAAWLVTDMLMDVRRPDLPDSWFLGKDAVPAAWKTGTSFGRRDAWAVGFSSHLAVGVWVGSPEGKAIPGISGSRCAGPLLFDVLRALDRDPAPLAPDPSLKLTAITLCDESRLPPGPYCPKTIEAVGIEGVSRLPTGNLYQRFLVDAATGLRLSGECLQGKATSAVVAPVYPARLAAWWASVGLSVPAPPPLHPDCQASPDGVGPRIVSPSGQTPYYVRASAPKAFQSIRLEAWAPAGTTALYWLQDGRLIARGPPDAALFVPPTPGEHRLVVQDQDGRLDAVTYTVE